MIKVVAITQSDLRRIQERLNAAAILSSASGSVKVGDKITLRHGGYPKPDPEWREETIEELRLCEDYDDKEGRLVQQVSWTAIENYEVFVVFTTGNIWGRNDDLIEARRHQSCQ